MKVVALTSVSCPYVFARYSAFDQHLKEIKTTKKNQFILIELGQKSITYQWEIIVQPPPYQQIIFSDQPVELQPKLQLFKKIWANLDQCQPDVLIILGYARISMLIALSWTIFNRKVAILLSESKEDDEPRSWWKEKIKRSLVKQYASALVGGKPHKNYLQQLGMPEEAIFTGYDVVGNSEFRPDKIRSLSSPLNQPFFLAINRFVAKKNLPFLLKAYANYLENTDTFAWHLVLCGDGEMRPQIEQQIHNLGIQDYVHLPGFLQQEELLHYFAHAKCFIHASQVEQWGLVVNEAMAAGLPVLVSDRCGCYQDLVLENINGYGFDPSNTEQLTELMLKLSSGTINLDAMGKASLAHIQNYSPEHFAKSLFAAINYALKTQI